MKRNRLKKLIESKKEPNYKEIAKEFKKKYKLSDEDLKQPNTQNKYYRQWRDYMLSYYPEWAYYPAYIWRGWGYVYGPYTTNPDQSKDNPTTPETPSIDNGLMNGGGGFDGGFSGGDAGGGGGGE